MSSFASRRFCGILHPRCTERLRTLSNVQSDAFTGLIYASRRDQISGMRTVHVHAIGIESPGRCHIVIAKPGYSWVAKIAEDVVTDPMVFCTTVYIVIYILLLLQSFVASSVQFVNEGTWEFRVCSTLLLRWAAPAGIDSLPCIRRSVVHQHRVFGLLSAADCFGSQDRRSPWVFIQSARIDV